MAGYAVRDLGGAKMSDHLLSALAAMLFVVSLAACLGLLYLEWAAPWLIEQMAG